MLRRLYLASCLALAAATLAAEWVMTSPGEPGSAPDWLYLFAYLVAPLLVAGVAVGAVAGVPLCLFLAWRRRGDPRCRRHLGRVTALAVGVVLVYGAAWGSTRLRLYRLSAAVAPLTAQATAFATGERSTPPALRVRGCGRLTAGAQYLSAECARGLGAWDELLFAPGGAYPRTEQVERIGAWAYRWD